MTINKTLGTIVLASALALGTSGCGKEETIGTLNSQNYQAVHENVRNDKFGGHGTNLRASRANYLQQMEIFKNNEQILKKSGLEVDVSKYLSEAQSLQLSAENSLLGGYGANLTYKEALYQLNEAIIVQQRTILGK
ncbi:hypothetical protein HYX14_05600 [Candidatus Woesearchaeota archaeon]|nr:hypothetical protein [Candidatus Woesearchaeota archaeon]